MSDDETKRRRGFHAYLSDESSDGWARASAEFGVSMTALAEIIGRGFASGAVTLDADEVEQARQVDQERRARRR